MTKRGCFKLNIGKAELILVGFSLLFELKDCNFESKINKYSKYLFSKECPTVRKSKKMLSDVLWFCRECHWRLTPCRINFKYANIYCIYIVQHITFIYMARYKLQCSFQSVVQQIAFSTKSDYYILLGTKYTYSTYNKLHRQECGRSMHKCVVN